MTISIEAPRPTHSFPTCVLPFAFLSVYKKVIFLKKKPLEIMQIFNTICSWGNWSK